MSWLSLRRFLQGTPLLARCHKRQFHYLELGYDRSLYRLLLVTRDQEEGGLLCHYMCRSVMQCRDGLLLALGEEMLIAPAHFLGLVPHEVVNNPVVNPGPSKI